MKTLTASSSVELEKIVGDNGGESRTVVLLFTGSKNESGKSWCPDCVVADPVIEAAVKQRESNENFVFVTIPVGDLATWKNADNQYRKHATYAVNCVPTLINVTKGQRLEEGGCADQGLVNQLFEGNLENSTIIKAGTCEGGVCRIR